MHAHYIPTYNSSSDSSSVLKYRDQCMHSHHDHPWLNYAHLLVVLLYNVQPWRTAEISVHASVWFRMLKGIKPDATNSI